MAFSSTVFLFIFLPLAVIGDRVAPKLWLKNAFLLAASLLFYAFGEPFAVLLLLLSAVLNYGFGRLLEKKKHKKAILAVSVLLNLGLLVFYKYTGFLVSLLNEIPFVAVPVPQIALPIGISFFTFQAMSYVIDVYRGDCKPQHSLMNVMLYLAFFPQLVAGPIVKYHDIEQQMTERVCTAEETAKGIRRFIFGLSKKLLIANVMAQSADLVFSYDSASLSAPLAWLGAIAYMAQIYFDFSGYSDMAIGLGHIFGFSFQENFRYPYIADSIQDFWRRWHISVSSWFKEYLYIPLGGNRKGKVRTCINKAVVFFCTGLWHGANLTFIVWGLLHGACLLLEDTPVLRVKKWWKPFRHLYTLFVVCCTFVVFRADTLSQAVQYLSAMFTGGIGDTAAQAVFRGELTPLFFVTALIALIASFPIQSVGEKYLARYPWTQPLLYSASLVLMLLCLLNLSTASYNPFIYFRF